MRTKTLNEIAVALVKPDTKAKKDCPLCRGKGVYTALHVGEYDELPMSMKCACTNEGKKKRANMQKT